MIDPNAATADVIETSRPSTVDRKAIKTLMGTCTGPPAYPAG